MVKTPMYEFVWKNSEKNATDCVLDRGCVDEKDVSIVMSRDGAITGTVGMDYVIQVYKDGREIDSFRTTWEGRAISLFLDKIFEHTSLDEEWNNLLPKDKEKIRNKLDDTV